MDKSGFFVSFGASIRANRTFLLVVLLILVSVGGYFWWRSGFTLDISRFFAAPLECQDAAVPWSGTFDIPPDAVDYRTATYHDPEAGCTRTTYEPGVGGSVQWDPGAGTYTVRWDPNADPRTCGRYQLDVTLFRADGSRIDGEGVGLVLSYGVDCGVPTGTPPPTTITPPPTTITPPPTTITPPPCPAGAPASLTSSAVTERSAQLTWVPGVGGTRQFLRVGPNLADVESGCPQGTCIVNENNLPMTQTSYQVTGLIPATAYYWRVVTYNDAQTCFRDASASFVTLDTTPTPTPPLMPVACTPASQTVAVGENASLSGSTPSAEVTLLWFAPGGQPSQGSGTDFQTRYTTPGFKTVTVALRAGNQATCTVTVVAPTPTPTVPPLICTPTSQTATSGQPVTVTASGGTPRYAWSAPGGDPSSQRDGATFTTTFASSSTAARTFPITVTDSAGQSAVCSVTLAATPTPTVTTPPPTPTTPPPTAPALSIQKTVRNVSQNGAEQDSVNANPSEIVEFIVRVSSIGTGSAQNVIARDTLPSGLTYQAGSTTVDGVSAADGLAGSGLTLGTMAPGRTITIRFRAAVSSEAFFSIGTTTLVNTAYASGSNVAQVSDTAFVNVIRNPQTVSMSLTKMGRNISRGQTGEHSPVNASPEELVEFVLRVRNTSAASLTNVQVRDIIPQGIAYVAGTAKLNGQPLADSLAGTGVNIGTLAVGQTAIITFSGRIAGATALPSGTTTLINTAQASADGVPMMTAQLPIVIINPIPVSQVDTGPGESTVLALIISAIITLLYVGYTSTDTYRRREAGHIAQESKGDKDLFNFRR